MAMTGQSRLSSGICCPVWKCASNPANAANRSPLVIRLTGSNHASAVDYAADMGVTVEGRSTALECFFATAGLAEREGAIERKIKHGTKNFATYFLDGVLYPN
jgi:hypothetical protein